MASSTELKDWLAAARDEELVRRTAHWMSEALTDTGPTYREDPGLIGLPIIDALVASAVETVALRRGEQSPRWTSDPARFLDHFWYPGPRSLFPWALAHAPAPFKLRGVLIEADSLASV
ncbi:MAG: hypothetical protein WCF36_16150 [Candidatus Nanopelagicales bacterium]